VGIAPLPGPPGDAWNPAPGPALSRARAAVQDSGLLVRGGVRLGELRAVRAAARELPLSQVAHGDFRAANLVLDEDQGRLVVLEWAALRPAPRHRDLLTLWATAVDEADRRQVAEAVLDRTAGWEVPDVGLLWHAVALEQLVARLTRPDRGDGLDADFARARLAEARRLAQDLGSPVVT
jgi:aminoglycoside phosphotransferase (APT) family kinase protein